MALRSPERSALVGGALVVSAFLLRVAIVSEILATWWSFFFFFFFFFNVLFGVFFFFFFFFFSRFGLPFCFLLR